MFMQTNMGVLTRREFIRVTLVSGGAVASLSGLGSLLGCGSSCSRDIPTPTHGRRVLADLHVHPMMNDWIAQTPPAVSAPIIGEVARNFFNPTSVSWKTCHQARIDLLCVAHFNLFDEWLSMPTDPNPDAPRNTLRMMDMLEERLLRPCVNQYAVLARNRGELRALLDRKGAPDFRVAVVHTIEGGHALGGLVESVDTFAKRGVALITLTHFFNKGIASSPNAFPFFPDNGSRWSNQGLSEFGAAVIERMECCGVIVDVTHTTSTALEQILNVAKKPLVATHSSARTLGDHPYSLYDEHIQEIAGKGGIVGIVLYPYVLSNFSKSEMAKEHGSLRDVVRSVRYVSKLLGTHKNIGLGSDFGGYIGGPSDMHCLGKIDLLRTLLLEEFDGDANVVEDIMANNVLDFMLTNWKSGRGECRP